MPECPTCGFPLDERSHGWLDAGEPGKGSRLVPCPDCAPAVQARRLQERLERVGVGQRPTYAAGWSWDTLLALPGVDAAAVRAARDYAAGITGAASPRHGLYLYGRIGRGKTSAAICVLKDAEASGHTVGYIPLVRYFRALKSGIAHQDPRLAEEYERLRDEVDVLVLDDMGVERPSGFVLEELYGFIQDRADRAGCWTIITSNYGLGDLLDLWIESRGVSDADRVTVARICARIRRHYTLREVAGANLCPAPAGETAANEGEDEADEGGEGEAE